jgi:hypothetical protein
MTTVYSPFGLRPVFHPSGTIRPNKGTIASAYANNIFQGSPVALDVATGGLRLAPAGAAEQMLGAFQGVEYTPGNGRRVYSNYWPAAQVATDIVAYYTQDPAIVYEIQANAALVQDDILEMGSITANGSADGNTTTGFSTVGLDASTVANTADQLQILGFAPYPDNIVPTVAAPASDAFPIVQVQIATSQIQAQRPVAA